MKIIKKLTLGILGIVILSLFAQISILASQPIYSDIMIVQVGNDDVLSRTGKIVVDSFSERNEVNRLNYKNAISNLPINLPSTTMTTKIDLKQLAFENYLLDTNYLVTTISDLKNGILDKYSFSVLIVIGHGTSEGLVEGINNDVMLWDNVNQLVNDEGAYLTLLSSCFSYNAAQGNDNVFGFAGEVDYQLVAYATLALIYNSLGETSLYQQAFAQLFNRAMDLYYRPEIAETLGLIIDDPIGGTPPPPSTPYMSTEEYIWAAVGIVCIILLATTLITFNPLTIHQSVLNYISVKGFLAVNNIVNGTKNYKNGVITLAEWCGLLAVFLLKMFTYILAYVAVWQGVVIIAELGIHIGTSGISLALLLITVILTIVLTVLVINSIIHDFNDADGTPYPGW